MSGGAAGLVDTSYIVKMKQDREPAFLSLSLLCIFYQLHFNGKESTVNRALGGSTYPS